MSFQIPLHFEDLTRSSVGPWKVSATSFRDATIDSLLQLVQQNPISALSSAPPPTDYFKAYFTLIHRYTHLSKSQRVALVQQIDKLCRAAQLSEPSHVKIAAYFAAGLALTAATVTPPCKFWEKSGRETILEAIDHIASNIPKPSPFPANDTEQFAALLLRMALQVLEQTSAARDKNTRSVLARILSAALLCDSNQTLPAITAILHALNRHEHLPTPIADILYIVATENETLLPFVSDFVREIARLSSDDLLRDNTAAKACSSFLSEISERLPRVVRSNLALVLSQLDGDSYMMRNGVVHVIGVLIKASPDADDPLLDVLMERSSRDVHAFTRSKAMQTWISLAEERVIPNRIFPTIAEMAASRLDDKTAAVRKYAAQLLVTLLKNNPFGPALRKSHFQDKLDEICASEPQLPESITQEEKDTQKEKAQQHSDEAELLATPRSELDTVQQDDNTEESTQHNLKKRYYEAAVMFIQYVEIGLEKVFNMLRSKSITDVSEAVSFLITAVQFQLEAAAGRAVRNMLPLVLARESNIRGAAVNAYIKLLAPGGIDTIEEKDGAIAVANGLTALGVGATTGELACLEALISAMVKSKEACIISHAVIAVLWDMFAGRVPGASVQQRRTACILVGMIAADHPESLQQRVNVLESVGLTDPSYARWSCVALSKLPQASDTDDRLSAQLSSLAKKSSDLSTVEQAINSIFWLCPNPEVIMGALIRDLASQLHSTPADVPVSDLSRFLFVIGHVAVKELVRIESLVSQVRRTVSSENRDDGDNEEEEQMAAEADKSLELAEMELVSPTSLLGRYGDLARRIAADRNAPSELQASSVLCMAKLMCVQADYCESNLRLLFSILDSSLEPLVRSNAVTALGDLAFRFPNLVEPWSSRIYSALQDKNEKVRKNSLMALTHLILNDMIKVKGQIVGIAICILDSNIRIADLARLFFFELARKAKNAIYNILPDTISCMSKMENLKSEHFKKVVAFLVGLMDKERHADGMVEKLCHRFRTSEGKQENCDLAYCLSLLNISEKGVKKLNENFKSYSSALCDDDVYNLIVQAINKGKKPNNSAAITEVFEELFGKIAEFRKSAEEEGDSVSSRVSPSRGNATEEERIETRGRQSRKSTAKKSRRSRRSVQFEKEEETDEGEESEGADVVSTKENHDDANVESEILEEGNKPERSIRRGSNCIGNGRAKKRASRTRKVVDMESSDDCSSDENAVDDCSEDSENACSSSDEPASVAKKRGSGRKVVEDYSEDDCDQEVLTDSE